MSSREAEARRIADGPTPSQIVRSRAGSDDAGTGGDGSGSPRSSSSSPVLGEWGAAASEVGSRRSSLSRPLAGGQVGIPESTASNSSGGPAPAPADPTPVFDPLRLCIFATVALLGWLLGPLALLFFAGLGFAGYWRARRAGLTRSKCVLRDTRLVLAYLSGLAVLAGWGSWQLIAGWLG